MNQTQRTDRFLTRWLWLWPAIGLGVIAWYVVDPSAWRDNQHCLWSYSLLGTGLIGWTWSRTKDRHYLLHFLVTVAVLAAGGAIYWTY